MFKQSTYAVLDEFHKDRDYCVICEQELDDIHWHSMISNTGWLDVCCTDCREELAVDSVWRDWDGQ